MATTPSHLSVTLTPTLKTRLLAHCKKTERSASWVIRRALARYLESAHVESAPPST